MIPKLKELLERRKAQTDTDAPVTNDAEVVVEESVEDSDTPSVIITDFDLTFFRDEFSEIF